MEVLQTENAHEGSTSTTSHPSKLRERALTTLQVLKHEPLPDLVTPAPAETPIVPEPIRAMPPTLSTHFQKAFTAVTSEAQAAVAGESLANERRFRLMMDMSRWGVPRRYLSIDLNALRPDLPRAYVAMAARLLALTKQPKFVAMGGARGLGKTALACGLIREFARDGRNAYYVTARTLIDELTATEWDRRLHVKRKYSRAHLLVVDEVQDRSASMREEAVFGDLLDARYSNEAPTLLVTNLEASGLQNDIGGKLFRRLGEEGGYWLCNWPRILELIGNEAGVAK